MSAIRQELEQKAAVLWQARRGEGLLRPAEFFDRRRAEIEKRERAAFVPAKRTAERLEFSLMFFSASAGETAQKDLYRLVHEAAHFADAQGFSAIWMPERHFHSFGGPYPNPAVLAASLARSTTSIKLRAGSVVLPLHHPAEVAETWAMVDNLSGGRVELSFGKGWNPNDFITSPNTFDNARNIMRGRIEEVRRLWRGESLNLINGQGERVQTRVFPLPVQPELPVWISATGSPETFAWAGGNGFSVLTMLLGGDIGGLAPKIAVYRAARREAGLDPDAGKVALMLHTFVHPDGDFARATIREPLLDYIRNSVDVQRHGSGEGRAMSESQRSQLIDYAFERYTRLGALFGSPAECQAMLEHAAAAGADEIACLIDFGVDEDLVLDSLQHLAAMRPGRRPPSAIPPAVPQNQTALLAEPIAIIGMSGCFAGAPDLYAFWEAIREGRGLMSPPPPGRGGPDVPPRGGFLGDIEGFDPALFGIAPAEAAVMDPHQRIFLEQVWAAIENAGYRPSGLRGSGTGVFAAVYSNAYEAVLHAQRATGQTAVLDGLAVAGTVLSMVPNRTSYLFDWTGPSEAVNTACSSGLVALHRAVLALRAGECGMAIAGGVSLLLAAEETAALARLGILSPDGHCRSFDTRANGQVRGEGAGVLVLKTLSSARRDGDFIHAVIRGTAVNHGGGCVSSLTLPNPRQQAACMAEAIRRSGVSPACIGYIEAHGAGTAVGDMAELSAFTQAFAMLGELPALPCRIGSVKPNIGSLDAAGGIAGVIKAVLALKHRWIPPLLGRSINPEGFDPKGPFRFADVPEEWHATPGALRAASVHAYGLGGTNAHTVLEEYQENQLTYGLDGPHTVTISAQTEPALRANVARLLDWLERAENDLSLADIAYTLATGRENFGKTWSVTVAGVASLRDAMRSWLTTGRSPEGAPATPIGPGRRIPMPGTAFARPSKNVAAAFYDFVTQAEEREGDIFLTLAPFPAIVPGFSWTRTFQDPDCYPGHWAALQSAQREMREVLFSNIDFKHVSRVLDFGCGIGTDLVLLAQRYPGLQGTGYTISVRQARIANARIAAAGLSNRVFVHHRDSAQDAFPETYDVVFGFEVAHHIADKTALFANISGHLKEGGTLVLADCAANTVAPVELPHLGSFTSPKADYAALLARHGFVIREAIDVSQEIANFLHDPSLETMIARESAQGETGGAGLIAAVQRSWDGFGQALRTGLMSYLLITAQKQSRAADKEPVNRQQLGLA